MEYNLIKTLETNFGYVAEEHLIMTPFPADLSIVPGIGQIVNNLSIVIPLHNTHDLTTLSKKSEFETTENIQEGGGNNSESVNATENATERNTSNEESESIPFNEAKRKAMDETIYKSFMHPKMFKTSSLNLDKTPTNVTEKKKN